MKVQLRTAAAAAVLAATSGAPVLAQTSGPKAVYWLSADTSTGMAGMMGMGGMDRSALMAQARAQAEAGNSSGAEQSDSESTGSVVGGALGGQMGSALGGMFGHKKKPAQQQAPAQQRAQAPAYPAAASYSHSLSLQLGSVQHPTGAPSAEHLVPAGLQVGASLPLVTPVGAPVERGPGQIPQQFQRPKGRILIFWGCGEHAPAPITVDMATMGAAMAAGKAPALPTIAVNTPQPPSAARYATYGVWPNEQSAVQIPDGGSLVGSHTVRGDYSPEMNFAMDQAHDFMAPLNISTGARTPAGAEPLSWNSVPGATGYYAWFMGADPSRGTDDMTMVMWTSSARAAFMSGLMDYLPPSEVRRLITSNAVMPPSTTQCTVPAEALQAAPMGMLSMIAYGDELNLADPPKPASPKAPWNLTWTVKARFKSTAMTMLGIPGMGS